MGIDSLSQSQFLEIIGPGWEEIGRLKITETQNKIIIGEYIGDKANLLLVNQQIRSRFNFEPLYVSLSAINPYRIWLIVVLVSFVSFLGYILIKLVGSKSGIGLTGIIGGLVSSTVTTISFAKRSQEATTSIPIIAAAIILASSIMFPRLIVEIGIFNPSLMKSIAVPLLAMGVTGFLLAAFSFWKNKTSQQNESSSLNFDNPFSLKSALTFAIIFTLIISSDALSYHLSWELLVTVGCNSQRPNGC